MEKIILVLALCTIVFTPKSKADSITVSQMITQDSALVLAPGVADILANNLIQAQENSLYAAKEPDSLLLSVEAVLRAIQLEAGWLQEVTLDPTSIVFMQSNIAIDDRVSVSISYDGKILLPGQTLNFGDVVVGGSSSHATVPEPSTIFLLAVSLLLLFGFSKHLRLKPR